MTDYKKHLYVVILCGGGGTRVWPLSVKKKPKQFLNFYSDKTLFQETVNRAMTFVPVERIIVITNHKYVEEVKKEMPDIPYDNIIGEPNKKDTAMAMGVAAAYIYQRDNDAVIINFASDHVISKLDIYKKTLNATAEFTYKQKVLASVGITPTFAHPGLGYIKLGDKVDVVNGNLSVSKVSAFTEKPDIKTAKKFLKTGQYLWNANNYIWRADVILNAFDDLAPNIAIHIRNIQKSIGTKDEIKALKLAFEKVKAVPIDIAISEKTNNLVVVPGHFIWHDIGGWKVVYDLGEKDKHNNVNVYNSELKEKTPIISINSSKNLIYSSTQPIAIVGLDNIIVVDTGSGLLICDKNSSNDVKKVVQTLKDNGDDKYL